LLIDRSYNYEYTWKFIDNFYYINMNFYDSFDNVIFYKFFNIIIIKFSMVIGSSLNLLLYSLEGMLPYDLSKIEEILQMQKNLMDGKENSDEENMEKI